MTLGCFLKTKIVKELAKKSQVPRSCYFDRDGKQREKIPPNKGEEIEGGPEYLFHEDRESMGR